MSTTDDRIAALELLLKEQHGLYMFLFTMIFRSNDEFRLAASEAMRLAIQNSVETHPISDIMRDQLRSFRDELLKPPMSAVTDTVSRPPVRPV